MTEQRLKQKRQMDGSAGGMVKRFCKMLDAGMMPDRTVSKKNKSVVKVKAAPGLK